MMTTRSLSGQHAEGSKREDTGSDNFASETNGLLMWSFIAVTTSLPGPEYPLRLHYFRPLPLILATRSPRFARIPSLRLALNP